MKLRVGIESAYVFGMSKTTNVYYAQSSKSATFVRLKAKTLLGAKREAWAWITERCTGVSVQTMDDDGMRQTVAIKRVDPITGKVQPWQNWG